MSRYRVTRQGDHYAIVNEYSNFAAGYITPTHRVLDYHGDEITMVGSVDEDVAALAAHRAAQPPCWEEGGSGRYMKLTQEYCDSLVVEQKEDGRWTASRNDYELADKNCPKTFRTAKDARRAADCHADDGRPNAKCPNDGLRWSGPSDPEEEQEERLHFEYFLGETVADAAEAISRARAEQSNGGIKFGTVNTIRGGIERLWTIRDGSLFGSYDTERGSRDPFFVVMQGGAETRISFEEAAHHYGMRALRKRLGADVSDETLRQMIADVLKRLPGPDRLRKAA